MEHFMAVRTDRAEVFFRIDLMSCPRCRKWPQMMHVDKACSDLTINLAEIKITYSTRRSEGFDASRAGFRITLVPVHIYKGAVSFPVNAHPTPAIDLPAWGADSTNRIVS